MHPVSKRKLCCQVHGQLCNKFNPKFKLFKFDSLHKKCEKVVFVEWAKQLQRFFGKSLRFYFFNVNLPKWEVIFLITIYDLYFLDILNYIAIQ